MDNVEPTSRNEPDALADRLLRDHGLRVTVQRRLVLSLLIAHEGRHWTADEILTAVRGRAPEVARGTAYNVLEELVRVGVAEELASEGSQRYGLRLAPHHHFVCHRCRRWFDVVPTGVEGLALRVGQTAAGFRPDRVDVTFHGLCPDCAPR